MAGELAALAQLGQMAWWQSDAEPLVALAFRFLEMEAAGSSQAVPLACLARALVADLANRAAAKPSPSSTVSLTVRSTRPGWASWTGSERRPCATSAGPWRGCSTPSRPSRSLGPSTSRWWRRRGTSRGGLQERSTTSSTAWRGCSSARRCVGVSEYAALIAATHAMLAAVAGRTDDADRSLRGARTLAVVPWSPLADVNISQAEATLHVARGDEAAAAQVLAGYQDRFAVGAGLGASAQQRALTIWYVLVPSTRPHWDEAEPRPLLRRGARRSPAPSWPCGRATRARSGRRHASSQRWCAPSCRCPGQLSWASPGSRPTTGGAGRCSSLCGRRASRTCAGGPTSPAAGTSARPAPPSPDCRFRPPVGSSCGSSARSNCGETADPSHAPEWRRRPGPRPARSPRPAAPRRARASGGRPVARARRRGPGPQPPGHPHAPAPCARARAAAAATPRSSCSPTATRSSCTGASGSTPTCGASTSSRRRPSTPTGGASPRLPSARWSRRWRCGGASRSTWRRRTGRSPTSRRGGRRSAALAARAGELLLAQGDADRARELGELALEVDAWSDRAHHLVVRAHAAHRRPAGGARRGRPLRRALARGRRPRRRGPPAPGRSGGGRRHLDALAAVRLRRAAVRFIRGTRCTPRRPPSAGAKGTVAHGSPTGWTATRAARRPASQRCASHGRDPIHRNTSAPADHRTARWRFRSPSARPRTRPLPPATARGTARRAAPSTRPPRPPSPVARRVGREPRRAAGRRRGGAGHGCGDPTLDRVDDRRRSETSTDKRRPDRHRSPRGRDTRSRAGSRQPGDPPQAGRPRRPGGRAHAGRPGRGCRREAAPSPSVDAIRHPSASRGPRVEPLPADRCRPARPTRDQGGGHPGGPPTAIVRRTESGDGEAPDGEACSICWTTSGGG